MRWKKKMAMAVSVVLSTSGCSVLPSQGPTASSVLDEANYAATDAMPRFLVADLTPAVIAILDRTPHASLVGRFGERGGATATVIGVGDTVQVTIWEAASGGLFSSAAVNGVSAGSHSAAIPPQIVGRDGSISVPYAGRIRVAGLSPKEVESAIITRLVGKAIEPQALVTVPKTVTNTVTVTGEVTNGARVPISDNGDRILDVIASSGGLRAPVNEAFILLSRGGKTERVPMQTLIKNPRENIYVRPGDVLTVVREPQTFTAFGATGKNALVPFEATELTLEEALAKAGGLLDNAADPHGVFLMRIEPVSVARQLDPAYPIEPGARYVSVIYRINLRDANTYFLARRMAILNKDMIYVAASASSEFYKAMMIFSTVAQPAMSAAYFAKK